MACTTLPNQQFTESACESICEAFERDFRRDLNVRIEDYLATYSLEDEIARCRLLVGLVHSELELRLRKDEPAELWQYTVRFPEISVMKEELLAILRTEVRIRHQRKKIIDSEYYSQRYPALPVDELLSNLGFGAPNVPGYEIMEEIGRGGMGVVYRAHDVTLRRDVAIKVVRNALGTRSSGSTYDRFERIRREATIMSRLEHPGIPPVHTFGCLKNGQPYLVMRLIRGQTLATLLKSRVKTDENLLQFITYFENIAQAVGYAHSVGIVHRDLNPSNIMIGAFGEVQVMDWGLAKEVSSAEAFDREESTSKAEATQLSHIGLIVGTPEYMAPEQARREEVDARTDVFGLGAILAAVITGHPVFAGNSTKDLISKAACGDVSDVLRRLEREPLDQEILTLAKDCLTAKPTDRPENGGAVANRVSAYRAKLHLRICSQKPEVRGAKVRMIEQRLGNRVVQTLSTALILAVLLAGLLFRHSCLQLPETELGLQKEFVSAIAAGKAEIRISKSSRAKSERLPKAESYIQCDGGELNVMKPHNESPRSIREQNGQRTQLTSAVLDNDSRRSDVQSAKLQIILGRALASIASKRDAVTALEVACASGKQNPDGSFPLTNSSPARSGDTYWYLYNGKRALQQTSQLSASSMVDESREY